MNLSVLPEIEKKVNLLSYDEQLRLIEHLVQNLRISVSHTQSIDTQLAAMASDPEIQRELIKIEQEFARTELDGLEK